MSSLYESVLMIELKARNDRGNIVLRAPELDRYKIYIPVTYYGISYVEGADYIPFVNCGTSFYYFKYNKKLKRYKFLEKKAIH